MKPFTPLVRPFTLALAGLATVGAASAQDPLTTRCESAPIAALFKVFGDTGRMPPDLGRFLQNAALQKIEPYKAFDNVYSVGICLVSAGLIRLRRQSIKGALRPSVLLRTGCGSSRRDSRL